MDYQQDGFSCSDILFCGFLAVQNMKDATSVTLGILQEEPITKGE